MVKNNKLAFTFDATKKARFGVLARYANNEALIKWFELPNCFIFHNGKQLCGVFSLKSLKITLPLTEKLVTSQYIAHAYSA